MAPGRKGANRPSTRHQPEAPPPPPGRLHPLANDVTIALNSSNLVKFLISIGKQLAYVDLEASPVVGKDNPPDLADLVPSGVPNSSEPVEKSDTCT